MSAIRSKLDLENFRVFLWMFSVATLPDDSLPLPTGLTLPPTMEIPSPWFGCLLRTIVLSGPQCWESKAELSPSSSVTTSPGCSRGQVWWLSLSSSNLQLTDCPKAMWSQGRWWPCFNEVPTAVTTLQYIMNAKFSQHEFCNCHENRLIKAIQTIPHNLWVSVKSASLYWGLG